MSAMSVVNYLRTILWQLHFLTFSALLEKESAGQAVGSKTEQKRSTRLLDQRKLEESFPIIVSVLELNGLPFKPGLREGSRTVAIKWR